MKNLFLLLFFIISSFISSAQGGWTRPNNSYGTISNRASFDSTIFYPTGCGTPASIKAYDLKKSGLYFDSCNHKFWVYNPKTTDWDTAHLGVTGVGTIANVKNGIRLVGDTSILGDSIDRYTYIQVANSFINNSPYRQLRLGNRTKAQSLNGLLPDHILMNTYTPVPFAVEGMYGDAFGDGDSTFYGGLINTTRRLLRDSVLTDYGAGKKSEFWSGSGYEGVNQYFPPRDTMDVIIGRDGQSGNTILAQMDVGNSFGYNMFFKPVTDLPEFPISNIRSSIDLVRVIDNTRRKKMTGSGFTGFIGMYKSYQTAITMATFPAGNYWERMFDFVAYGDAYPSISGATKAYTLSVAEVNKSFGFYARPHYLYTNTVRDGYGFVSRGDSDYNHLPWLNIGPYSSLPSRSGLGNKNWTRRLFVNGDMESTGNSYSFVSEAYGMAVKIPVSIGNESAITFSQTDSALTGIVGGYHLTNRDSRGLYLRSEGYSNAVYDNAGTGMFVQVETGANHAFITRWHRNGNMAVGHGSATNVYRLYKKLTVNGSTALLDTLTIKNLILQAVDSTGLKPLVADANGNVYKGYWGNAGAGGGGGSGTVTNVATGYGLSGGPITNTGTLLFDSATAFTHLRATLRDNWNIKGNAATAGSQTGDFIGTTNSVAWRIRTNNTQRMYVDSARNQLVIGAPTIDANNSLMIGNITNGNYDGIALYRLDNTTATFYGTAGIRRAGAFDINTTSSGISFSPNTGVYIGTAFGTPTALLHINGSTTSRAALRLVSTGALPTAGNILAGNIDAISDKLYYTIATGPAQKEVALVEPSGGLTINRIPYVSTNGRLTDAATFAFNGSSFTLFGAVHLSTAQITTTTTLTATMKTVRVDASGGAVTVDLPDATTCQGREYSIKLISSSANAMTIDGNGSQTIDGATTKVFSTQYTGITIQSNGTNWDIIGTF